MKGFITTKTLLFLVMLAGSMAMPVFGASGKAHDNCSATTSAIDRYICEQPALRVLQDALARNLQFWQQHCAGGENQSPRTFSSHASWLAEVRKGYDRLAGVAVRDYLGSTFTQRADELAHALSSCVRNPDHVVQDIHITTVRLPVATGQDEASSLPFVQTTPPLVGIRINDALFRNLLQMEAPASPRDKDVRLALSRLPDSPPEAQSTNEILKVFVLWRNPGLLVLQVDTSGCETRCWQNSEQLLFDLRTGDRVEPDDLLSPNGRLALDRLGERSILQEAVKLRRRDEAQWTPDGLENFKHCLNEWRGWRSKGGRQIVWRKDKRWLIRGPACAGDGDAMPSSIDSKTFSLDSLTPYLSPYGRSLLLGEGDVRMPGVPPDSCPAVEAPPDPNGWGARVAQISAGSDHVFLRESSGRVWGWGKNYNGALGKGDTGGGKWIAPFVIGEDYLYAGAGQGFSAVVRRDGSLLTWGSGYAGRLGDGGGSRERPERIGENFVYADVDNNGGRALANDGRLWAWDSNRPRMEVVASDVQQMRGSIPVLFLRSDGGLWAWNEWEWTHPAESKPTPGKSRWHGAGFEHLPASRKMELAWRADGSVWAWGRTLTAMSTPVALPGLEQSPWPRLVGEDWADVKTSESQTLVAARKSDGSLWVSQEHGSSVRMDHVGCGFVDMAFAYDRSHGVHLLALRSDGTLLDYHGDADRGINVRSGLLARKPEILATNGIRLFQEGDYWGEVGAEIFLLRQDGTLWRWYWRFAMSVAEPAPPPAQRLERIEFPKEWFSR